ncbi:hypothetical protein DFH29DRAFT_905122, partial [Suillus ampliporus]
MERMTLLHSSMIPHRVPHDLRNRALPAHIGLFLHFAWNLLPRYATNLPRISAALVRCQPLRLRHLPDISHRVRVQRGVRTVSSGAASHYNAPSTSSSVYQQMPRNFAIQNSNGHNVSLLEDFNTENFPWYCVWTRALERHTFPSTVGESLICNIAPQHTLVRSFDPAPPDTRPSVLDREVKRGSVSPFSSNMDPRTPSRHTQPVVKRSHVIPDFVQILRRIRLPLSRPPVIEREKVIFFAEIKPKRLRSEGLFESAATQISRQAYYAFSADSTLMIIGIIVAFGNIWQYVEISRPAEVLPSNWSEFQDPTFGNPSNRSR